LRDEIAATAKPKITYKLKRDGSVILQSLKGITVKALKKMNRQELNAIGLLKTYFGINEKFFPIDEALDLNYQEREKTTKRSPKSKAILSRSESLTIAKNFGFNGTPQNLYDWAKAALTAKSDESRLANSEKLAAVGLVAVLSPENKPAWTDKNHI